MANDSPPTGTFESNRAAFLKERPKLLEQHKGKFVLFHGDRFVDAFHSMAEAYEFALKTYHLDAVYIGHLADPPRPEQVPALSCGLIRAYP